MKAQQCVKLTSTNRPFGLNIELTPRSNTETRFLPSLVTPNQFRCILFLKIFWRQLVVRVPDRPGRNHPGQIQMSRPTAGNHPPSATQVQRRRSACIKIGISAQGPPGNKAGTLKTSKFAGDHTARDHPFPSRTRKLSLAGPMVLHGQLCGRLGDRRQ